MTAFQLESVDPDATAIPRRADTPFAGHFQELQRLRAVYAEVVGGGGARMVAVVGEPGIGKSRLARELMAETEPEARVLVGRCPPYGEGMTFSPVREVFRAAGAEDSELDGSSLEVIRRDATRCSRSLPPRPPGLAVFDDIHWAEETMLDLLEHLAARLGTAPVLAPLPCASRAFRATSASGYRASATTVLLDALSESDSLRPDRGARRVDVGWVVGSPRWPRATRCSLSS